MFNQTQVDDEHFNKHQTEALHGEHNQQNQRIELLPINTSPDESHSHLLERLVISTIPVEQTTTDNIVSYSVSSHDMQAENFGAEKGAPSVCIICCKNSHTQSECPELSLPKITNLPCLSREWHDVLSRICRQVTDEYKATRKDINHRKEILQYLQSEFQKCYPSCCAHAYGSSDNGFALRQSDLDICVELKDNDKESSITILGNLYQKIKSNSSMFINVEFVSDTRIPVIRLIHSQSDIEIDISLNNLLALENTRLLKTYTKIDSRVSELGYMLKCLTKTCDIADVSRGTLSSYAYILMLIHFLQQIQPPVLPVLQQLDDDPSQENGKVRSCEKWNVYFYDNLSNLKQVWINKNGPNVLTSAELWIAFLRYYTEQFNYRENIVTIRQLQPLNRHEKGWFHQTIAIEDPFILTHNLADRLSLQKWALIRRVFVRARAQFGTPWNVIDIRQNKLSWISVRYLFYRFHARKETHFYLGLPF
ncbi:unnamed protein product [Adineta steineri]|uniref:PAP-associated domain-containing protein n=1 Tax=Adineta steineri TaxID=433720 RepID=A0A814INA4_9BILA|nr:unnamed protein product [Adineta steineri]CAF4096549.1 unnamed protein product [Adineta steineri]